MNEMMRYKPVLFVALIVLGACARTETPTVYRISGDISELATTGTFEISTVPGRVGLTVPLLTLRIENGVIDVSFVPGDPEVAWLAVKDDDGRYIGKSQFVLEPGNFTITTTGPYNAIKVRGDGPLNNELFYSWQDDPQYLELTDRRNSLDRQFADMQAAGETEAALNAFYRDETAPVYEAVTSFERDAMAAIAFDDSRPLLALLAITRGGALSPEESLPRLDELERILGTAEVAARYRARVAAFTQLHENSAAFGIGSEAVDFTLPTLAGDAVSLSAVLAQNELVLLEFWAVWCAPCRAEIPYMKRAYAEFSDEGFEIISVTLDSDRGDWERLSVEENIPWYNAGDLLAYDSPVIKDYGVVGLPRNYLVNRDMEIIAVDLRQEALGQALAEHLGRR